MALTVLTESPDVRDYDKQTLMDLYEVMVKIRIFDKNLINLMQIGKYAGFYHSGQGQEAIAAGTCALLNDRDVVYYAHRGANTMIAKGTPLVNIYGDFLGRVIGTTEGLGAGIVHCAWPEKGVVGQSGTVGESLVLGPGTAYAQKFLGEDAVTVSYFGDGASARELFHGGLNFAGLHKLPVIFVCENNEFAVSTHFRRDHSIKEYIAERAEGYCIPAYVVDGNDVLMVLEVMRKAIEIAKNEGPVFIEAKTFRHYGHYIGDNYEYVDKELLQEWKDKRDPITNFKQKIMDAGIAEESEFDAIDKRMQEEVDAAIAEADASPLPPAERIYEGLYSKKEVE